MLRTAFILGLTSFSLLGCSQPGVTEYVAPALDAQTVRAVTFTGAVVDASGLDRAFNVSDTRSVPVRASVETAALAELVWDIGGARPAQVLLTVNSLEFERDVAGLFGQDVAVMRGTVSLVDAATGAVIVAPTDIFSTGIGWVADGDLPDVTQADRGTELTELAEQFVARARRVLLGA